MVIERLLASDTIFELDIVSLAMTTPVFYLGQAQAVYYSWDLKQWTTSVPTEHFKAAFNDHA